MPDYPENNEFLLGDILSEDIDYELVPSDKEAWDVRIICYHICIILMLCYIINFKNLYIIKGFVY